MDACLAEPTRLQRRPRVRCLRTMAFAPYADVPTALRAPGFAVPAPDATAMIVFDGHTTYAFNLVSAFMWDLLDGSRSLAAVARVVGAAFGVDQRTAAADVRRHGAALLGAGLVEPVRAGAPAEAPDSGPLAPPARPRP